MAQYSVTLKDGTVVTVTLNSPGQKAIGANTQVLFNVTGPDGSAFQDAVVLTPAEVAATTPAQILALQRARYINWRQALKDLQAASDAAAAQGA